MSALSYTSGLSIIAVLIILISVCIAAPKYEDEEKHDSPSIIQPSFFQAIGTMSFAFVGHQCSFIVHNSLEGANKAKWNTVSKISMGLTLILSLILSLTGYLCFRDTVEDNV